CQGCARSVQNALSDVAGVEEVEVDVSAGRAVVGWSDGRRPNTAALEEAVRSAGYAVSILPSHGIRVPRPTPQAPRHWPGTGGSRPSSVGPVRAGGSTGHMPTLSGANAQDGGTSAPMPEMARMDLVPAPRDSARRFPAPTPAARPPSTAPANGGGIEPRSFGPGPGARPASTPGFGLAAPAPAAASALAAAAPPVFGVANPSPKAQTAAPSASASPSSRPAIRTGTTPLPRMIRDDSFGEDEDGYATDMPAAVAPASTRPERIPTAEMPIPIFPDDIAEPVDPSARIPSTSPVPGRPATVDKALTNKDKSKDKANTKRKEDATGSTSPRRGGCCGGDSDSDGGDDAALSTNGSVSAPSSSMYGQRSWLGSNWFYSVAFGVPAMLFLMLGEWAMSWHHHSWFKWVSLVLSVEMLVIGGSKFYMGAWRQIRVGRATMDTLVSIGSTAAFGLSVYGMIYPDRVAHLYFMETVAILTFVSLGHWVEEVLSSRASQSLALLLRLTPHTARRLRPDGGEEVVPVATLGLGDNVIVKPGDAVPVDGEVIHGESTVDEQMLTGESVAVAKKTGSPVFGGTINQYGALRVKVNAVGEATAIARIAAMVRRAQHSRANIERMADRVSSWFVPAVLGVAVLTLLVCGFFVQGGWVVGIMRAIAVLIVACPCAMGLATPMALMAGINAAARRGILIRDGQAIEKAGSINTVLFDKTGTLTDREPQLEPPTYYVEEQLEAVSLAHGLASPSHHPMSEAVCRLLQAQAPARVDLENWKEEPGAGVSATWDGRVVRLGSLPWLRSCGVDLAPREAEGPATASELGVADEDQLVMSFPYRTRAANAVSEVVHELEKRGKALWLISGDSKENCLRLAEEAGLSAERVFAETKPDGKAKFVTLLQSQGHRVAFIGDGINDGPALAQANLGIAVTGASDVAKESADIVLVNASVAKVPEALRLADETLKVIQQNLFWAFIYNAIAIPLAAFGLMSPIICALAMGLSDVCVVANSLRLLRK
ncbi:MAG TPA: heavy metal translocating P-type ATPase, partial [Candidatus Methylacidiphilales bacterium]|nr:heavy metal translocating P-type ATPase [Candidatus Methylacidiphilales bacterium]